MVLMCRMAIFGCVAVATYAATAAARQEDRRDLNIVIPGAGGGSGKLVVHGARKRDVDLDDVLVRPEPAGSQIREYGDAVVSVGQRLVRVAIGRKRVLAIPADPKKLSVWTIGDLDVLIGNVPGEVLTFWVGGCCAFWNLLSPRLDPLEARPPVVYCSKYEDACRPGFVDALGERGPDPLCRGAAKSGARTKRCMVPGAIRVAVERNVHITIADGDPGEERKAWDAHAGDVSEYEVVSSGTHDYWSLGVGEKSYLLVIGPGEKWTVKVKSDGSVSGVRD
jgi:hypothetical protein